MLNDQMTATPIASGTTDAQAVAATLGLRLMGYSVKENAGSPDVATLVVRNGTTSGDTAIVNINLAASGSDTQWYGPQGVPVDAGVFIDRLTGESTIVVYTQVT